MNLFAPLAVLGLAAMACSGSLAATEELPEIGSTLRYEVPQPDGEPDSDPTMPLRIEAKGKLTWARRRVKRAEVAELFANLGAPNFAKMAVVPAGDVAFGDVIAQLSDFGKLGGYQLLELESYAKFAMAKASDGSRIAPPPFVGTYSEYELPLVVGFDVTTKQCLASVVKWSVGSEELYDRSFHQLDAIVHHAGGVEALLKDEDALDQIVARLQSAPNTPWRCIAGAMHNVEKSGWPYISLEVIEQK